LQRELHSSGEFKQTKQYQTRLTYKDVQLHWSPTAAVWSDTKICTWQNNFWVKDSLHDLQQFFDFSVWPTDLKTLVSMRCQHWRSISRKDLHLQTVRSERREQFLDRGREESECIFGFSSAQKGKIPAFRALAMCSLCSPYTAIDEPSYLQCHVTWRCAKCASMTSH